jgi:protein tyrosine phosphatase
MSQLVDCDEESDESNFNDDYLKGIPLTPIEPLYANLAQVTNEEKPTVNVRHFRVTNWPDDADFPADFSTMITLYSEVVECMKKNPGQRVLVHCL